MISDWCLTAGKLISQALAQLLGIPEPQSAALVFAVQVRRETANGDPSLSPGVQNRNPLNLTTGHGAFTWPGQVGTYGGGNAVEWHGDFASFRTIEAGCWACASNYDGPSYQNVIAAFRADDPVLLAHAIELSPWDSGHYGYTLADEVKKELGMPITRDQYASEIEPLVKETIKVMIEQDGETRNALAALAPSASVDAVVKAVAAKLAQ